MKNNTLILILILLFSSTAKSQEIFNFDVTEAEILNDGNIFKGLKRGIATTNDGVSISADTFKYNKNLNILYGNGNVIIDDSLNKTKIFTEDIIYLKDKEIIFTKGRSKAIDETTFIEGDQFEYKKKLNILNAKGNVLIDDSLNDIKIFAEDITYLKNQEKIFTKGDTKALIKSQYNFESKNVSFLKNEMRLLSYNESTITDDKHTVYKLDEFDYLISEKILKGKDILVITNFSKPNSDKTYFSEGIFNLKSKKFSTKDTKVLFHKELFDRERVFNEEANNLEKKKTQLFKGENNPRIYGISSYGDQDVTIINKGIFTSCKKNDTCPPWSLKAKEIKHDKKNQNVIYKNAILNLYDVPVFYFPKFFHPDPSVDRRSGLLQPRLNSSSIVGTSVNIPYFHVISENKDITFKPTIFDDRIYMFQNEYRQENENSSFIADFGYTKGYKSKLSNNRNGMSHVFSKYKLDLNMEDFTTSEIDVFLEKVSMDTFLGVFENALLTDKIFEDDLKDHSTMTSGIKINLDHENYNFTSGLTSYEKLQTPKNSDRYQFVLPYYDYSTSLFSNSKGAMNFSSSGDNTLSNTNNLKSIVSNKLTYQANNIYSNLGFVGNYGIHLKNLNSIAKNDTRYKSSLQSEILNINEFNITYPLLKEGKKNYDYLTPKISFRINPSNMKNHSTNSSLITTDNAFSINRLGLSESFESGKSLTFGLDYRKENKNDMNKFFEIKFAKILRDTTEYKIPYSSSLQGKSSNLFGSIESKFYDFLTFKYDFSLDNNFSTFEHNNVKTEIKLNNLITEFHFHESNGKIGSSNYFSNETTFNFDDNNSLMFKTRRNRKISLTEYYDFIYEYQNDCLTAAVKYRKTYYQDRDIVPKEDLFFTLTLFPLATVEQKIDSKLYRDDKNDIIWK